MDILSRTLSGMTSTTYSSTQDMEELMDAVDKETKIKTQNLFQ